jgi:hypothetical protein
VPDVAQYVREVARRVVDTLGDQLSGIYTTGSLALDGYTPQRSDIDLIAVVHGDIALRAKRKIARDVDWRHLQCPARGLEFVTYPESIARSGATVAGFVLEINTGCELSPLVCYQPAGRPRFWFVIDRDMTYQCGEAVHGPDPRQLFRRAPYEDLLPVVTESMRFHAEDLRSHLPESAVLNGCRALRYLRERCWSAKPSAGEWAIHHIPFDRPLIEAALAARQNGNREELPFDRVAAFLRYVVTQLEAARGRPEAASLR